MFLITDLWNAHAHRQLNGEGGPVKCRNGSLPGRSLEWAGIPRRQSFLVVQLRESISLPTNFPLVSLEATNQRTGRSRTRRKLDVENASSERKAKQEGRNRGKNAGRGWTLIIKFQFLWCAEPLDLMPPLLLLTGSRELLK